MNRKAAFGSPFCFARLFPHVPARGRCQIAERVQLCASMASPPRPTAHRPRGHPHALGSRVVPPGRALSAAARRAHRRAARRSAAPARAFCSTGRRSCSTTISRCGPSARDALAALLREGRARGRTVVRARRRADPQRRGARAQPARRARARCGARRRSRPPVLYCPDSFGHPAMLPALARGFRPAARRRSGAATAARAGRAGDTARWRGADGDDRAPLPSAARRLRVRLVAARRRRRRAHARWARDARRARAARDSGVLLVPTAPTTTRASAASATRVARARGGRRAGRGARSLARRVRRELRSRRAARASQLPAVRGELRDSYGYTWTLQGTFGTRAAQKRRNARAERCSCATSSRGSRSPRERGATVRDARCSHAAWRTLLARIRTTRSAAARSTRSRARWTRGSTTRIAQAQRDCATTRSLDCSAHDAAARARARARGARSWSCAIRAARARGGVAELRLRDDSSRDVAVGPGSATRRATRSARHRPRRRVDGARCPCRSSRARRRHAPRRVAAALSGRRSRESQRARSAWVAAVAGYGARVPARDGERTAPLARRRSVRASTGARWRTAALRVDVDGRRVVALATRDGAHTIASLIAFEDADGCRAISTRPRCAASHSRRASSRARGRCMRGPLRGELVIRWRVEPHRGSSRRAAGVRSGHVTPHARRRRAPFVRIEVDGDNGARTIACACASRTDVRRATRLRRRRVRSRAPRADRRAAPTQRARCRRRPRRCIATSRSRHDASGGDALHRRARPSTKRSTTAPSPSRSCARSASSRATIFPSARATPAGRRRRPRRRGSARSRRASRSLLARSAR